MHYPQYEYKVEDLSDGLIDQDTLNKLGDEGWKLVNIHEDFDKVYGYSSRYILMRVKN